MKNRFIFIFAALLFAFLAIPVPLAMAQSPVCMGEPSCPNPGNVCKDGTVFAGCSPDDAGTHQYRLFVTRCDAGQTWGGASCTGTRSSLDWGSFGTARGTESVTDGEVNTNTLAALGAVAHPAAHYCSSLTIHGYDDWYLPAAAEAYTMMYNKTAINTFEAYAQYQSSTEMNGSYTFVVTETYPGTIQAGAKSFYRLRCMRRY